MHDFAGIRNRVLDVGDGIAGFRCGARGEVYACGVVGGEVGNCLLAQAGVACPCVSDGSTMHGVDNGGCVPPVTKMILPSKLPMSRAGSKEIPIPKLVIGLPDSGTTRLYPNSSAVVMPSRNWRTAYRAVVQTGFRLRSREGSDGEDAVLERVGVLSSAIVAVEIRPC
jgi:hypothetical protein